MAVNDKLPAARFWFNLVSINVGWFACVLGAAGGLTWVGPCVVALLVVIHLAWDSSPAAEAVLIGLAIVLGFVVDSVLAAAGVVSPERWLLPWPASPFWMVVLWANLATCVNVALKRLQGHVGLAAIVGAFAGPSAYYSGARLGAVTLADPLLVSLVALAVAWAIATPLLLWIGQWVRGQFPPDAGPA